MVKTVNTCFHHTNYKIYIGKNILEKIDFYHKSLFQNRPKLITYDKNLYQTSTFNILLKQFGNKTKTIPIKSGEESKSIKSLEKLYNNLLSAGIDRDSVIYALGGGVIGDLVGFAAATILRGVDYVQIPTTLLSQIDSSVGGKTAINNQYGKNLIGSFYQPKLVIIDIDTLSSLSQRQMKTGYAEMVKYAIINDLNFFKWLEKNGRHVLNKEDKCLEKSIHQCISSKVNIVSKDEKDKNERALLNLGHTFAHAFEKNSNYSNMTHGEAVSVGLLLASKLSNKLKYCDLEDTIRIEEHLGQLQLPTKIQNLFPKNIRANDIIASMKLDKKNYGNIIRFILIKGIGKAFICDKVKEKDLKEFLIENGAI